MFFVLQSILCNIDSMLCNFDKEMKNKYCKQGDLPKNIFDIQMLSTSSQKFEFFKVFKDSDQKNVREFIHIVEENPNIEKKTDFIERMCDLVFQFYFSKLQNYEGKFLHSNDITIRRVEPENIYDYIKEIENRNYHHFFFMFSTELELDQRLFFINQLVMRIYLGINDQSNLFIFNIFKEQESKRFDLENYKNLNSEWELINIENSKRKNLIFHDYFYHKISSNKSYKIIYDGHNQDDYPPKKEMFYSNNVQYNFLFNQIEKKQNVIKNFCFNFVYNNGINSRYNIAICYNKNKEVERIECVHIQNDYQKTLTNYINMDKDNINDNRLMFYIRFTENFNFTKTFRNDYIYFAAAECEKNMCNFYIRKFELKNLTLKNLNNLYSLFVTKLTINNQTNVSKYPTFNAYGFKLAYVYFFQHFLNNSINFEEIKCKNGYFPFIFDLKFIITDIATSQKYHLFVSVYNSEKVFNAICKSDLNVQDCCNIIMSKLDNVQMKNDILQFTNIVKDAFNGEGNTSICYKLFNSYRFSAIYHDCKESLYSSNLIDYLNIYFGKYKDSIKYNIIEGLHQYCDQLMIKNETLHTFHLQAIIYCESNYFDDSKESYMDLFKQSLCIN